MHDIYAWQQAIWQKLTQKRQWRGHALLLKGKQGIGKFQFARHFAKALLCTAPTTEQTACGKCLSCGWFEQQAHPNFFQIIPEALAAGSSDSGEKEDSEEKSNSAATKKNASKQISIEQIRKLTEFVYMTGHQNGYKIILIHPAESMNSAAANALLKKLEEPPADVLFLLVTHQAQHLLPTIRSRCQQIAMPIPDVQSSIDWLKQQCVSDPETSLAAASFSPLAALAFEQDGYAAQHDQFIQQIGNPSRLDPLALAEAMQPVNLSLVVSWLQKWCYDLVSYRTTGRNRYYLKQLAAIQALSGQIDLPECITFTRALNSKQKLSHHPLNPRLFLEELLIAYRVLMNRR